ncbi:MAG: WD40/YVTN/BNR-like repeat-containing protein, partial [Vicinamibacterales bacterium]
MKHVLLLVFAAAAAAGLQVPTPSHAPFFAGMRWRFIGPPRPGRSWIVAGVPGDPATYYLGTPAGALWKTTSGGTTWTAISDAMPVTGFGAVAVAPSNPSIVYAGTGNTTLGDGVYRSDDAGATWRHVGLDDTKYITALVVDP